MKATIRAAARLALAATLLLLSWSGPLLALNDGAPVAYLYCYNGTVPTSPLSWAPCDSGNPLVISGGGGGGLSVQDGATFTAGTSNFTPGGGEYNSSPTALTSGTQGTFSLNQYRALNVDTPTTNNNLYAALIAASTCQGYTNATTASQVGSNTVTKLGCDLYGNLLISPQQLLNYATHAQTSALASSLVAKASAGQLYGYQISADTTLSAAPWWVVIFDATSFPSNGAITPAGCVALPSGTTSYSVSDPVPGVTMATGITVGVSTTGCFTLTSSAHAFISALYN
jgi:hypothetical protein